MATVPAPGGKILVIDDEAAIREIIAEALKGWGYDVRVAKDGDEGIRLFREYYPDVVITDFLMPRVTGLEVAQALKALDPDAVVIVLTGLSFTLGPGDAERLGVEFVESKPVPVARLRELFSKAIERRRARQVQRTG